jgi:hypothetical protein
LAYIDQNFPAIKRLNHLLFWAFDPALLKEAEHIISTYKEPPAKIRGKKLSTSEIISTLETYITNNQIADIKIKPLAFCPMKFMLVYQKTWSTLVFPDTLSTRVHSLMSNIIHEIGTHHRRHVNGKKTWRNLLTYGTAFYQKDEEGLAMYQAYLYLNTISPWFHKKSMYEKYFVMWHAEKKSYWEVRNEIIRLSPYISLTSLFKRLVRLYTGIKDTSAIWAPVFLHNKIYLDWFTKIQKRHQQWNDLSALLTGKIAIEDIKYTAQMPDKQRLS